MSVATLLRSRPDTDLARLCRVLIPFVLNRSWDRAEQVVTLWEKIVAADQSWYWMPAWQAAEAEADAELAAGEFDDFTSMDDMIVDLESAVR